jgi:hypothetical protein
MVRKIINRDNLCHTFRLRRLNLRPQLSHPLNDLLLDLVANDINSSKFEAILKFRGLNTEDIELKSICGN